MTLLPRDIRRIHILHVLVGTAAYKAARLQHTAVRVVADAECWLQLQNAYAVVDLGTKRQTTQRLLLILIDNCDADQAGASEGNGSFKSRSVIRHEAKVILILQQQRR